MEQLERYVRRNFPGARYRCVYEAGYCGFWIHDALRERGIEYMVVNPGDVPTKHKERRSRNDRVDARKLLNRIRFVLKNRQPYQVCVVQ